MRSRSSLSAAGTLCAVLLLAPLGAAAQLPELPSLRVSGAPAFVLLGVSPTAVDRPSSPTDLGLDLADRTGVFQSLPRDFALETSPYWLLGHPRLTWRADSVRSLGQSMARTFAISAASAQLGDASTPSTGVSLGLRVLPLSGRLAPRTMAQLDTIEQALGRENELYFRRFSDERARMDSALTAALRQLRGAIQDPGTLAIAQAAIAAQYQGLKQQLEARIFADSSYRAQIAAGRAQRGPVIPQRLGPMLELAAASMWTYPDAVWSRGRYQRAAVWAALSYEGPKVTPVLLLRFQGQASDTLPTLLDVGGRLIRDGANWGVSLEGVWRHPLTSGFDNLYRVAGMFEYEVLPATWLVGTFGRDFQTQRSGSVLAQLGVKITVNAARYAPPEH